MMDVEAVAPDSRQIQRAADANGDMSVRSFTFRALVLLSIFSWRPTWAGSHDESALRDIPPRAAIPAFPAIRKARELYRRALHLTDEAKRSYWTSNGEQEAAKAKSVAAGQSLMDFLREHADEIETLQQIKHERRAAFVTWLKELDSESVFFKRAKDRLNALDVQLKGLADLLFVLKLNGGMLGVDDMKALFDGGPPWEGAHLATGIEWTGYAWLPDVSEKGFGEDETDWRVHDVYSNGSMENFLTIAEFFRLEELPLISKKVHAVDGEEVVLSSWNFWAPRGRVEYIPEKKTVIYRSVTRRSPRPFGTILMPDAGDSTAPCKTGDLLGVDHRGQLRKELLGHRSGSQSTNP